MNSSLKTWLGWLGCLVFAGAALGQPSNDNCANAIPIGTGPAVVGGTTVGATVDGSTLCGSSNSTPDVWYSITVGCSGTLSVDTCVNPEYDTVLSIHSGCPGTLGNTLACNDDAACFGTPSLRSNVSAAVGAGTYLIRVSGFNGATGNFVLSVFFSSAPSNDSCSLATAIGSGTFTGSTSCATREGAPSCGSSSSTPDVWYSFATPCDGTLVVDSCGSAYDTVLSIHSGCPGSTSNQVACNDDAPSGPCSGTLQSLVSTPVTAGTTYLIRVSGFNGARGNYTIHVSYFPVIPANNNCLSATPVTGNAVLSGSTVCATNDGSASCGSSATAPDVWYTFGTFCSGTLTVDTCGSDYDTVLSIHSGCPGTSSNLLACNDDAASGPCAGTLQSRVSAFIAVEPGGNSVAVRVSGFSGATGIYTVHFNFVPLSSPSNDSCGSAASVAIGSIDGSTSCASNDGTASCGASANAADVWYRFTAPTSGTLTADTCGGITNYDTVLSIHSGCPGTTANEIACNDDSCSLRSQVSAQVTGGSDYLIRVAGFNGHVGDFTLNVHLEPFNNSCANAITIGNGSTPFFTIGATTDGPIEANCPFCCNDPQVNQDVWYRYTATATGPVDIDMCTADYDSKVAVYAGGCPSGPNTAIACNDDSCGVASQTCFTATAGSLYTIRVGGFFGATGSGSIRISPCYANCDCSANTPVLNVLDFACFLNKFAAGDPYANCDQSTTPPVLNVLDFSCFLNRFAAGCP